MTTAAAKTTATRKTAASKTAAEPVVVAAPAEPVVTREMVEAEIARQVGAKTSLRTWLLETQRRRINRDYAVTALRELKINETGDVNPPLFLNAPFKPEFYTEAGFAQGYPGLMEQWDKFLGDVRRLVRKYQRDLGLSPEIVREGYASMGVGEMQAQHMVEFRTRPRFYTSSGDASRDIMAAVKAAIEAIPGFQGWVDGYAVETRKYEDGTY